MESLQIQSLRKAFSKKRNIYFDHNATTPVSKKVRRRMKSVLRREYGNPSSLYAKARHSSLILEESRRKLANCLNVESDQIIFTSCASESNNAILKSLALGSEPGKNKIISSPVEHPSVMETLFYLQKMGVEVDFCPVDKHGRVLVGELEKRIDDRTILICCMYANNETGTINYIRAISQLARKYGVLLFSDCVQALGKIPVHLEGVDYASFSGHKVYGPKGVGVIYTRSGHLPEPLIHGGHQEENRRAGTEAVHNIAGFAAACENLNQLLAKAEKIRKNRDLLLEGLREAFPDVVVHSPVKDCLPNTLNFRIPGISNMGLMAMLDHYGIAVSAGSACSMPGNKPSHVLKAMGLSDTESGESLRISLGPECTSSDIRYMLRVLTQCVGEGKSSVDMILPGAFSPRYIDREKPVLVDVRPSFLSATGRIPGSMALPYFGLHKNLDRLERDQELMVYCQNGHLSVAAAVYLRSRGFNKVKSMVSGFNGWKRLFPASAEHSGGRQALARDEKYQDCRFGFIVALRKLLSS